MRVTKKKDSSKRAVSVRTIILPAVISVIIILSIMVTLIHTTSRMNKKLTQSLRDSAEYVEEISDFMGGVSLLSETSASFIVNPIDGDGKVIWGQIMPFAVELDTGHRRAKDLKASFADYDVTDETMQYIDKACEDAQFFLDTQLHAIALVTSVYPLPSKPALEPIAHLEISAEEAKMPQDARLGLAKSLVLNEEYGKHRKSLAAAINSAIQTVKESSAKEIEATNRESSIIIWFLWGFITLMLLILITAFVTVYHFLVYPLIKASKRFLHNKKLNENYGLKEFRIAATSYNNLLKRRDDFESLLKTTAETDVLTNLPNRYAFEHYIGELKKEEKIYPLYYYSFDVNYLKITNDTYGHVNGDKLLESSARIIRDCFGDNCFRIGGDEFAALLPNYSAEEAGEAENKFLALLKEEDISISFGSSVTNDLKEKTIDQMILEADYMMYDRKRTLHANEEGKPNLKDTAAIS